jgi:hypothetical protein
VTQSTRDWWFHQTDEYLGLNATAYRNTYASAGLVTSDRFVREVIQNSVDAHDRGDAPVRVVFERRVLTGDAKRAFVDALRLGGQLHERRRQFKQDQDVSEELVDFYERITDAKTPLPIMMVSDFNTVGLGGHWNRQGVGDHFGRLVMGFGVGDKAEGAEFSGGSFGFGKTVYAASTQSGVVGFYSVFQPTAETAKAHARFMATAILARHAQDDRQYSGFAFLGAGAPGDKPSPLIDDDAHDMAAACGLAPRNKNQRGSTILLIGCDFSLTDVIEAAEIHWWPRLLSNLLEIEVRDGDEVLSPRPKANRRIAPFVRAWLALQHGVEAPTLKKAPLRAFDPSHGVAAMKRPGQLMLTVATEDDQAAWDEEEADHLPSRDRVALIRSTKMVISYFKASEQGALAPIAGVFVADEDPVLDKILTYSEPPQHNVWDEKSDRFKAHFKSEGPKVVAGILRRIKTAVRAYQDALEPPRPKDVTASKILGKVLGRFLRAPGARPPAPPPGEKRVVETRLDVERVFEGGKIFDISKVRLGIREDAVLQRLACNVTISAELLGDDNLASLESQSVEVFDAAGKRAGAGIDFALPIVLEAGSYSTVTARTEIVGRSVTRMRVVVEELAQGSEP